MSYVILRSHGKMFRIQKEPFETHEQAMDRAWFIVKQAKDISELSKDNYQDIYSNSLQWIYEKYLGVTYRDATHHMG